VSEDGSARGDRLEPDWGLSAALDPASFGKALAELGAALARNPEVAVDPWTRWAGGATRAGAAMLARLLGAATEGPVAPDTADRRFDDRTWSENPWYFGVQQGYLLWSRLLRDLADAAPLEHRQAEKARFAVGVLLDALAPTNTLAGNPAALKRALETGGLSVVRGFRNLLEDIATNRGLPRQVDLSQFRLGDNLAATPGQVVFRNRLMELIQYGPQTRTVLETPLLLSPPWINKYYVMDLAPGRSFAEWAVQHGHTVFAISYRNPDEGLRDVGFADYLLEGPLAALDVIGDITEAPDVNIVGLCLGGTLAAILLGHLAARERAGRKGRGRAPRPTVRTATLLNALLDFSEPGPLGIFVDEQAVARLEERMGKHGYLDATAMSSTFTFLRANDLVWSYVASSWLMGEGPPAFDILAWNADSTRLPARMHSEYLRACYLENRLAAGTLELAGTPIRLGDSRTETYVVAAEEDHIAPWRSVYRANELLGGPTRFVLTSSGHVAGIVNPPSPKRSFATNGASPAEAEQWRDHASVSAGSWWEDWTPWVEERSGGRREPPPLGSRIHPPLGEAPGTYVLERSDSLPG
jgi:polyhydroxyalkanoate synthase